ncbi:hypothetical protein [Propionigenium maris]|uniref:hypothetical protein n=1 Tax=Propionigenium maris TaxID=45622 RepID=UPI002490AD99|nr:hypothetical protein [Propionigenium maris]
MPLSRRSRVHHRRFLALPEYISFDLKCSTATEYFDYVADVKGATDKFTEFITPILDNYKFQVKKERQDSIKEKLSDGRTCRVTLDSGDEIIFSSPKSATKVAEICKKIYPGHRALEPVKFVELLGKCNKEEASNENRFRVR